MKTFVSVVMEFFQWHRMNWEWWTLRYAFKENRFKK